MSAAAAARRQRTRATTLVPPPPSDRPTAPTNLRTTNTTANTVALAWGASTAPDAYPVSDYLVYDGATLVATVPATATTATISGLAPGSAHAYIVRARNASPPGGESDPSNTVRVTTDTVATTGMLATRAETLCRSWGTIIHFDFGDSVNVYKKEMADKAIELGVRVIRTAYEGANKDLQEAQYRRLHQTGAQMHITIRHGQDPVTILNTLKSSFPETSASPASAVFRSFGNHNEPNNTAVSRETRTWDWARKTADSTKAVWQYVRGTATARPDPVFGPAGGNVVLCPGSLKDVVPDLEGDFKLGGWYRGSPTAGWSVAGGGTRYTVNSQAAMLGIAPAPVGTIAIRTDVPDENEPAKRGFTWFRLSATPATTLSNWDKLVFHPGLGTTDIAAYITHGDYHKYPGGGALPSYALDQRQTWARAAYGDKPFFVTEGGYHSNMLSTMGGQPVPEDVQGKYEPIWLMEHYRYGLDTFGVGNVPFHYELMEEPEKAERESGWGLVGVPGSRNMTLAEETEASKPVHWYDKPVFVVMRNFLTILGDRDASTTPPTPRLGFTPGRLDFTLTGGGTGREHVVVQKADGVFYLIVWREVRLWSPGGTPQRQTIAPVDATVALNSGGDRLFTRYVPYDSPNAKATPAPRTDTSFTFALGEDLTIIKIG